MSQLGSLELCLVPECPRADSAGMAGARAVTTTARRGLSGFAGVQGSLSNYRSQGAPQRFRPLSAFGGGMRGSDGAPKLPNACPRALPPCVSLV
eukprot:COSAG04_NODE_22_length_37957_cov_250.276930_23_plen_94_part_00